jgi:hypothetical protein
MNLHSVNTNKCLLQSHRQVFHTCCDITEDRRSATSTLIPCASSSRRRNPLCLQSGYTYSHFSQLSHQGSTSCKGILATSNIYGRGGNGGVGRRMDQFQGSLVEKCSVLATQCLHASIEHIWWEAGRSL